MKARVKWLEDLTLIGESASGHAVVMDGPLELGRHNQKFTCGAKRSQVERLS